MKMQKPLSLRSRLFSMFLEQGMGPWYLLWGKKLNHVGFGDSNALLPRDAELPVVRGQRNHLCDLLGVPRPQLATKVTSILRIHGACAVCCSELLSKVNRVPQSVLSSLPAWMYILLGALSPQASVSPWTFVPLGPQSSCLPVLGRGSCCRMLAVA